MTLIILCLLTLVGAFVYLFPKKIRPYYLFVLSVLFFLCISPTALLWVAFVALISYAASHAILIFEKKYQKIILLAALTLLLAGVLTFIKYSRFFLANSIAIPMGLSYYTLMAIGGIIDIYRGKSHPENNFIFHTLYISFFPQVIAGPIGRIQNLAEQFKNPAPFDGIRIRQGFLMVLSGFFFKMVVADTLLQTVQNICDSDATGWIIFAAMLIYASVLYFDFSGYSLIAVGTARVMGIDLIMNFDTPYAACSMQEFWRRWHISLSSWFRDYVYFPLGGSKKGQLRRDLNTFIIFALSGAWHGNYAGYILWGSMHGIYLIIGKRTLPLREKMTKKFRDNKFYRCFQRVIVYLLFSLSMFPFYCKSLHLTKALVLRLFAGNSGFFVPVFNWILIPGMLLLDRFMVKYNLIQWVAKQKTAIRFALYIFLFLIILIYGQYGSTYNQADFIYGQF